MTKTTILGMLLGAALCAFACDDDGEDGKACVGFADPCDAIYVPDPCDAQQGCQWVSDMQGNRCEGDAAPCGEFDGRVPCEDQRGCEWK